VLALAADAGRGHLLVLLLVYTGCAGARPPPCTSATSLWTAVASMSAAPSPAWAAMASWAPDRCAGTSGTASGAPPKDAPESALYTEGGDLDTVVSYITAHS
jgi:hypothetical protein